MKGFGPAQMATPTSAVPSSWHDIDSSKPRYEGATYSMQLIAAQLNNLLSSVPPSEFTIIIIILNLGGTKLDKVASCL